MKLSKNYLLIFAFLTACSTPSPIQRHPTSLDQVDVKINGSGAPNFQTLGTANASDEKPYDAIVVGGGLAGLSATVYLTNAGKRVLLLDKEDHIGGLAAWTQASNGIAVDRGAAYWTDAYTEEQAILDDIHIGDYHKLNEIPEPIDSYLVRGKFYKGIWDDETLRELPASFDLFKFQLQQADADRMIPNQPFEDFAKYHGRMFLDKYSAKQWIEMMPKMLENSFTRLREAAANARPEDIKAEEKNDVEKNPILAWSEAQRVWKRYQAELKESKLPGPTGMQDVVELMDLYCRSALGNTSGYISAMAFANFYISEIVTRYTSPMGTGLATFKMLEILQPREGTLVKLTPGAMVTKIVSGKDAAQVFYTKDGRPQVAEASYVVYSGQLRLAPILIDGFEKGAPAQFKAISNLKYADYLVHLLHVDGHPYRATYDTWLRAENYSDDDPTDVILGRWMDPNINGYSAFRDFKTDPPDKMGFLTIYHPLTQAWNVSGEIYNDALLKSAARKAADKVVTMLGKLPDTLVRGPITVTQIETNRWPLSVHIAVPGYYTNVVPLLRKPFGRVIFGNNNLGTPAFEEALFRGHCAADNVLFRFNPQFQKEPWSRCAIE